MEEGKKMFFEVRSQPTMLQFPTKNNWRDSSSLFFSSYSILCCAVLASYFFSLFLSWTTYNSCSRTTCFSFFLRQIKKFDTLVCAAKEILLQKIVATKKCFAFKTINTEKRYHIVSARRNMNEKSVGFFYRFFHLCFFLFKCWGWLQGTIEDQIERSLCVATLPLW